MGDKILKNTERVEMENKVKSQFGLQIAIKVMKEAIDSDNAPLSVIFANLLVLASSPQFPDNLTADYFYGKNELSPQQSKIVKDMLELMKAPVLNKYENIIKFIAPLWVNKRKKAKIDDANTKNLNQLRSSKKFKKSDKISSKTKKDNFGKTRNTEVKKTTVEYKKSIKKLLDK